MKLAYLAVFLLVSTSSLEGQTSSGGLSFPGAGGNGATSAGFGVNNPGFPDTSARIAIFDSGPTPQDRVGTLPNAYRVRPRRFGTGASANPGSFGRPEQASIMVAFKDHTLDSAFFAWIQGDALHYLNLRDARRVVPLKRVDWKATKNLNPSWDPPRILRLAK